MTIGFSTIGFSTAGGSMAGVAGSLYSPNLGGGTGVSLKGFFSVLGAEAALGFSGGGNLGGGISVIIVSSAIIVFI